MESTRLVVLFVSNQLFGILQVYPAGIVSTALMSSYSLDNLIDLIQRGLMCIMVVISARSSGSRVHAV